MKDRIPTEKRDVHSEGNARDVKRAQVGGSHYQFDGLQPIDLMRSMEILIPFCQGSIIKYAARLFRKGGKEQAVEDLKKIQQYAEFAIEYLESKNG
jgi:hypothetical protein